MNSLDKYVDKVVQITFIDGRTTKSVLRKDFLSNNNYYFFIKGEIIPINVNKIRGIQVW